MLRHWIAKVGARARVFHVDSSGAAALLFSLAAVPILAGIGATIDYSRKVETQALVKQATDAAALAAMQAAHTSGPGQAAAVARQTFAASYKGSNAREFAVSADYAAGSPATVAVSATGYIPTQISSMVGFPRMAVGASSTAAYAASSARTWPVCVLIVASTQKHTLMTADSAQLKFNDCMVQVNTGNWDAVEARNSSSIQSTNGENCFVGDIHYGNVTPAKNPSCTFFADPFAGLAMPVSASTCAHTDLTVAATTIQPGTYCGNTSILSGAVTMQPGLYVVKDGNFTIGGSARVSAPGVTILLTGSGPNFYVKDNASFFQTAMQSGPFAGFALYLDNNSSVTACSPLTDGDQIVKSGTTDSPPPDKKAAPPKQKQLGIQNCVNAIYGNATANITGVVYTANASFLADDYAAVNVTGSFVSAFLVGAQNARFNLQGAVPSSSAIAAQMQKKSESGTTTVGLRLVK